MSGAHADTQVDGELHRPADSALYSCDPVAKLVALVWFVVVVVLTPARAVWAFGVYAVVLIVAARAARLPFAVLVRRLAIDAPFLLFAAALPVLGGDPRREILGLSLSVPGIWAAWNIAVKGLLGIAAATLLTWTTPVVDILAAMQRLRVPRAFTLIAGFMLRYLDVVTGELRRLEIARLSRGGDSRSISQGRAVAATVGTLFVRSYERGERVHQAMLARGFDGRFPDVDRVGARPHRVAPGVLIGPALATVVACVAWISS